MASVMSGTAGDRVLSVDLDRVTEITRKPDFVDVLVFADSSLGLGKTRKGRVISPEEEFGELCSSLGLVLKVTKFQYGGKKPMTSLAILLPRFARLRGTPKKMKEHF